MLWMSQDDDSGILLAGGRLKRRFNLTLEALIKSNIGK